MSPSEQYGSLLSPLLGRAMAYARSILRHRPNAQDVVQQAAMRGLERFASYDQARPFSGWWFAILRNCCIDALRSDKSSHTTTLEHDPPDERSDDEERWLRLAAAIDQLNPDHGEILRLKYFADRSYSEIAEALSIPAGTVMSRLYLARKALAEKMSAEEL
jgi:RNA polymerase sigma-70 factor, ECF subfamily